MRGLPVRERWRRVPGWRGYQVSDLGAVRSVPRVLASGRAHGGGPLAPAPDRDGYLTVTLSDGAQRWQAPVHVLVLLAFRGTCPAGLERLHGNGDRQDNRLVNLRYGTDLENARDKLRAEDWNRTGVSPPLELVSPVAAVVLR